MTNQPVCTVCGKPATWKLGSSPRCSLHCTTFPEPRASLIVSVVAFLLVCVLWTAPSFAEWHPPKQKPVCTESYWRSHRQGTCGWGTTRNVVRHIFTRGYATADCIVKRESGYYAHATNGQYRGLWQFGYSWYAGHFDAYNPVVATVRAWAATRGGTTWGPWGGGC